MARDACPVIDRQFHVVEAVEVIRPVWDSAVVSLGVFELIPTCWPGVGTDGLAVDSNDGVAAEAMLKM